MKNPMCAIVHWNGYTIEIRVNENNEMEIVQMRGVCNSLPDMDDKDYASEVIKKIPCEIPTL